jgi:hypothetical protein
MADRPVLSPRGRAFYAVSLCGLKLDQATEDIAGAIAEEIVFIIVRVKAVPSAEAGTTP